MADDRRQPSATPVELLALAKQFNATVFPRRLPNAAYLLAYLEEVKRVMAAKQAHDQDTDD